MSRLAGLLTRLCPEGIDFKTMDDLGVLYSGLMGKSKADFADGNAPFVSYVNVFSNLSADVTPLDRVKVGDGERQNRVRYGDVLFTASSESVDEVGMASGVMLEPPQPLFLNSFCFGFRPNSADELHPEFATHLFRSEGVRKQIIRTSNGVTRINVSKERFRRISIPVPPAAIQHEIAGILRPFPELDSALAAELELRRKQRIELARRLIVTAGHGAASDPQLERVRLGDISAQLVEPVAVQPEKMYTSLGVKWYGAGVFPRDPRGGSSIKGSTLYKVKPGQLIFNRMFVTEGSFALIPEELGGAVVSNEFPVYDLDRSRVLPEWLLLYLLDEYSLKRIEAQTTGTERGTMKSRRRWKQEQFEMFEIDLPPMEVQRKAAAALGTASDLEAALRAEQAARRTQYEYYRDRLLTFEEAV